MGNTCFFNELGHAYEHTGLMQKPAANPMSGLPDTPEQARDLYATSGVFFNMLSINLHKLPNVHMFFFNESIKHMGAFPMCHDPHGAHACEIPFVLGEVAKYDPNSDFGRENIVGGNNLDKDIQSTMREVWANFVYHGTPGWESDEVGVFTDGGHLEARAAAFDPEINLMLQQVMCAPETISEPCGSHKAFSNSGLRVAVKQWVDDREAAVATHGHISAWDTSGVTDMTRMFRHAETFNEDISGWDTSSVVTMEAMFRDAKAFNVDISEWNSYSVTNMNRMFRHAEAFNGDISGWETSSVVTMEAMFRDAKAFNQDISGWNTFSVTSMNRMFRDAEAFNQDIGNWNTEKVETMVAMFRDAKAFNGDISDWHTQSVTNMNRMFRDAEAFNQDIGNWNTEKVETMVAMFRDAKAFNQNIGGWDNTSLTDVSRMFRDAEAFNQNQVIPSW